MTDWKQRDLERERDRKSDRWAKIAIAIFAVLILVGDLAWHQYAYGDWKCTFMRCVKVEVVK